MPPKALMGVEAPPKRSKISLEAKLQVIKAIEDEPQTPKTRLAARLNLHYTTMMTIWADREKIMEAAMQGSAARKRVKVSKFVDLEKALVLWLHQVRRPGSAVNVYGTLVKAKAKTLALRLGIEGFTASNGWLFRFRKRNNVMFKKLCGESAEVDEDAVRRWSEQILPNLIKDYDLGDIYNADELGLFFNLMPDKSMVLDKDDEHGQSKARVTVLLGANATGTDKLPPLVIGKAKKPRCFAGIRTLPCPYSHNAKAWMNLQIFISWLKKLDGKMRATRRKIILFIDNGPAHPTSLGFLTNTRVEFLPQNTTSKLQPMDQGIFRTLKHYYRQKLVRRLLLMIDTGRPLQKKDVNVNLFQAMHFLMWAWEQVTPETIANCFGRAGVRKGEVPPPTPDDQDEAAVDDPDGATDDAILYEEDGAERPQRCIDLPPLDDDLSERWVEVLNALELNPEMDFLEYVTADDGVKTSEELSDEDLVALAKPIEEEPDATAAEDEEEDEEMTPLSLVDGVQALEIVRRYMSQLQNLPDEVFATINKLEILAVSNSIATRKQKSITDFFHKL